MLTIRHIYSIVNKACSVKHIFMLWIGRRQKVICSFFEIQNMLSWLSR